MKRVRKSIAEEAEEAMATVALLTSKKNAAASAGEASASAATSPAFVKVREWVVRHERPYAPIAGEIAWLDFYAVLAGPEVLKAHPQEARDDAYYKQHVSFGHIKNARGAVYVVHNTTEELLVIPAQDLNYVAPMRTADLEGEESLPPYASQKSHLQWQEEVAKTELLHWQNMGGVKVKFQLQEGVLTMRYAYLPNRYPFVNMSSAVFEGKPTLVGVVARMTKVEVPCINMYVRPCQMHALAVAYGSTQLKSQLKREYLKTYGEAQEEARKYGKDPMRDGREAVAKQHALDPHYGGALKSVAWYGACLKRLLRIKNDKGQSCLVYGMVATVLPSYGRIALHLFYEDLDAFLAVYPPETFCVCASTNRLVALVDTYCVEVYDLPTHAMDAVIEQCEVPPPSPAFVPKTADEVKKHVPRLYHGVPLPEDPHQICRVSRLACMCNRLYEYVLSRPDAYRYILAGLKLTLHVMRLYNLQDGVAVGERYKSKMLALNDHAFIVARRSLELQEDNAHFACLQKKKIRL